MNEKIKQLAEQAGGTQKYVPSPGVWQFFDDELEKFVELVVKECVSVVSADDEKIKRDRREDRRAAKSKLGYARIGAGPKY